MPNIPQIIENVRRHLRDIAGEAVGILKTSNKKIVDKLEEISKKKVERHIRKDAENKTQHSALLSQIKGVEQAVKNQKEVESISINNPEAITGDLKEGLLDIVSTLRKEISKLGDKKITVKNDIGQFASLFKSSQDKKSVIEALKKIEDKLDVEEKEQIDYTSILSDIATATENKEAIVLLKQILGKELDITFPGSMDVNLDPSIIDDKRVRVTLPEKQVAKMGKMLQGSNNTQPIVNSLVNGGQKTNVINDYHENLTFGDFIPGKRDDLISARNSNIEPGSLENIWEQGGVYNYLTTDTDLYISSTDAGDDQLWLLQGLDSNYNRLFGFATMNGHSQVLLSQQFFRVFGLFNLGSTGQAGDVYLAESDTLTGGVPDTASKTQMKVRAGDNRGNNLTFTIPAGSSSVFSQFEGSVGKGKNVDIALRFRVSGNPYFYSLQIYSIYEKDFNYFYKPGFVLGQKIDVEVVASTLDVSAPITASFKLTTRE